MKFSTAFSAIVLLLPVLAQAAAVPRAVSREGALIARQRGGQQRGGRQRGGGGRFGQGGQNQNGGNNNGGNNNGGNNNGGQNNGGNQAASSTSAAAPAATSAAADNNNGGNNAGNNNGGNNAGNGGGDPQTSLTLDPSQVQAGLAQNGQVGGAEAGQVPSLTSTNNFINFCLTNNLPLTDGQQKKDGSCNPTPMGVIVAQSKMPGAKFTSPKNGDTIQANTSFDIKLAVTNMETGNFVNPATNYFAAPAQVNGGGIIIAHSHVVVQAIPSLDTTEVPDSQKFAFFKGLNAAANNGVLTATVASAAGNGLPAGAYRLCSINTAANHQPILVAVAQHGSLDDCIYFTAE